MERNAVWDFSDVLPLFLVLWTQLCYFGSVSNTFAGYLNTEFVSLQGSVVVFGAWSSWTDEYAEYASHPEKYNYCANQPMMFAFVILIINWVRDQFTVGRGE